MYNQYVTLSVNQLGCYIVSSRILDVPILHMCLLYTVNEINCSVISPMVYIEINENKKNHMEYISTSRIFSYKSDDNIEKK